MAGARSKGPQIGSVEWIQNERHAADGMMRTEVEDFSFSVRTDLEWLNARMADVVSKDEV